MTPVILYRGGRECMDTEELREASNYFPCLTSRMNIQKDQLVIGRYSVLPFYRELEQDILSAGAYLINSYAEHSYVADLQNWVVDLGALTPETWDSLEDLPDNGPFVLKGATNSKKAQWRTHMYAATKREACDVYNRLCEDGLISQQKLYIRKFVPLVTYFDDVVGLPVTKEFRFFVYDSQILCGGYYWSNHVDVLAESGRLPSVEEVPREFLQRVIDRIAMSMFYVIDVAETAAGDWIVIELNDGQMSGLSMNNPNELYERLAHHTR